MDNVNEKIKIIAENEDSTVVGVFRPAPRRNRGYQSEATLENEFIQQLKDQGYEYLSIHNQQDLLINLRKQLEKLNHTKFSDNEWDQLLTQHILHGNDGIKEKTKTIQEDNIKNITLDSGKTANIVIFDKKRPTNNILQVVNQYEVNSGNQKNRYDVTILVNGLPLVHIELKKRGVQLKQAFGQINRYKRDSFWADGLYEYVQLFVISNGTETKYYSNTTRWTHCHDQSIEKSNTFEFTSYWADAKNTKITDLVDFTTYFFCKRTLLNILAKYCVFTSEERLLVMRPYQIVATERILNKIEIGHNYKLYGKVDAGGYIWHTTGSGKTLTSFKTAQLATSLSYIKKVIFIVDRKDLDYQTMCEYDRFQKGCANSNTSTKILEKQINDPDAHIIITTIQKLSKFIAKNPSNPIYQDEVVLIFDECHRSQFGQMHRDITKHFKKYYIFGFTGTPIFKENANPSTPTETTENLFGKQLHAYTILNAIDDQNVLKFKTKYYKTFELKEGIEHKKVAGIDKELALVDDRRISLVTQTIIDRFPQYTRQDKAYVYKQVTNINELSRSRNNKVSALYQKANKKGFNSIFATASVDAAKAYYAKFKELGKDTNLKIALIYSYNINEDENCDDVLGLDKSSQDFLNDAIKDYNKMFGTNYEVYGDSFQSYYKDVSMRMKNKEIDLLIVVNMFLTGFDAPCLNTLWVDKDLKYHGLLQAFSRTNRILNSVKNCGNIVCFRTNLENNLNDALKLFGDDTADTKGTVLMEPYEHYYEGYTNQRGIHIRGYKELVNELTTRFPIVGFKEHVRGEQLVHDFLKLWGQILKVQNTLATFDEFEHDQLLPERDVQDYTSFYIDLCKDRKKEQEDTTREVINDDIVYEIEFIKEQDINIDYILQQIALAVVAKSQQEKIAKQEQIHRAIKSSLSLRDKADLIEEFYEKLSAGTIKVHDNEGLDYEFNQFINDKKQKEWEQLKADCNLRPIAADKFIKASFEHGYIEHSGAEIDKILKPTDMFEETSEQYKEEVIEKLDNFFNRYYDISDK